MSSKLVAVWLVGAVFLTLAIWIIQNLELVVGVSDMAYYIALLIAFVLVLITGLAWISVAVATRHKLV